LFDPQTMLGHGQQVTAAARVWAHYAAAYDAALAIALIAFLAARALLIAAFIFAAVRLSRYPRHDAAR
jgi:hypothetical protein